MNKVKFYASGQFCAYAFPPRLYLSWRERWKALIVGELPIPSQFIPHPVLIQLEPGVYFGHPETVERVKAEVERLHVRTEPTIGRVVTANAGASAPYVPRTQKKKLAKKD